MIEDSLHMLFVVVTRMMGLIVVLFMLLLVLPRLVRIGSLALTTTYTLRGGNSSTSLYCGFMFNRIYNSSSDAGWTIGAT